MNVGCSIATTKSINMQFILLPGALSILLPSYTFDCFPIRSIVVLYVLLLSYVVCCVPMLPNCFGSRTCGAESAYNYLYCNSNIFIAHFNKNVCWLKRGLSHKFPTIFF